MKIWKVFFLFKEKVNIDVLKKLKIENVEEVLSNNIKKITFFTER
jgi:hypothetical protein